MTNTQRVWGLLFRVRAQPPGLHTLGNVLSLWSLLFSFLHCSFYFLSSTDVIIRCWAWEFSQFIENYDNWHSWVYMPSLFFSANRYKCKSKTKKIVIFIQTHSQILLPHLTMQVQWPFWSQHIQIINLPMTLPLTITSVAICFNAPCL